METQFWHERWEKNEIGFHQEEINVHLQEFWPLLNFPKGQTIFVPLCGKSKDMLWLLEQGYLVLGVEVSDIAVKTFFQENHLAPRQTPQGTFTHWEYDEIQILCGDFFSLTPQHMTHVVGVYDRASLVALPENLRAHYAQHLAHLLVQGTKVLLITLEYSQDEMTGPPFSVSQAEIDDLYQKNFQIQRMITQDVLPENPHLAKKGLTHLTQKIYFMNRFSS